MVEDVSISSQMPEDPCDESFSSWSLSPLFLSLTSGSFFPQSIPHEGRSSIVWDDFIHNARMHASSGIFVSFGGSLQIAYWGIHFACWLSKNGHWRNLVSCDRNIPGSALHHGTLILDYPRSGALIMERGGISDHPSGLKFYGILAQWGQSSFPTSSL